jgi:hypothetical protein
MISNSFQWPGICLFQEELVDSECPVSRSLLRNAPVASSFDAANQRIVLHE